MKSGFSKGQIAKANSIFTFRPQISFIGSAGYDTATATIRYPSSPSFDASTAVPEIAFIGQSNVGKSSLINALVGMPLDRVRGEAGELAVVRTSKRPGHTKTLNFFGISAQFNLVDMPGYGLNSRREWGDLVLGYLQNRRQLCRVFLLKDTARKMSTDDYFVMDRLEEFGVPFHVVLTKFDQLPTELSPFSQKIQADVERAVNAYVNCSEPRVFVTSSSTSQGIEDMRCRILVATRHLKVLS